MIDHRGLRVHFAPNPGDADELIEQLILADHSPRKLLVVSSDHRLQRAARRRRATAIDSDIWYAEIVRHRVARQRPTATAEGPKPAGPLSSGEVSYWLGKFGMAPDESAGSLPQMPGGERSGRENSGRENSIREKSDREKSDRDSSASKIPRDEKPQPEKPQSWDNPFPPGYGEDLVDE